MKKTLSVILSLSIAVVYLQSCYNNKYDIVSLPQVSFVRDVVPIVTAGPCGCHNLKDATNITQFSDGHGDIYHDAILARAGTLGQWAKGDIIHPGGGSIDLSSSQKQIINDWIAQGANSDYNPGGVSGPITFTGNIATMVKTACSGGSCHGGAAVSLTYTTLKSNTGRLTTMANANGAAGHPGGTLVLSKATSQMILDWISQGTIE